MSNLTVELPKLDKDDLKAIRSFLPGKLLGRTAALLSLVLLVLGFVGAVRLGVHQILEFELPPWAFWALLAICFLAVVVQIMLEWLANRNRAALLELAVEPGAVQTGYFRIGAYADTAEDRKKFSRPDQAERKVLEWLVRANQVPLYLTGDSGSGKSSLLNAFVLPTLRDQGWTVIEARAWQDPLDALGKVLAKLQSSKRSRAAADPSLRDAIEAAARKAERLLVALDQFEEFVILAKPESRMAFAALVSDLQLRPVKNFALLLVLRSDYQSLLEDTGLPALRSGENLFQVARFQLAAAEAFMKRSKLDLQPAALDRLLTSAAELDDTPGLVRPITINVIGYVLAAGRTVASSLDGGTLVRQYIEQVLQQPAIRDHAPRLLEKMITEQGTKRPRSEQGLATDVGLRIAEVRAVLNCLNDAGLARPLDPGRGEWELSHDFIARAIVRFLGRHRAEFFRRVAAYAAPALLSLAFLGGLGAVAWDSFTRDDRLRARLGDIGVFATFDDAGLMGAKATYLGNENFSRAVPLLMKLGNKLRRLDLAYTQIKDIEALRALTKLEMLSLAGLQIKDVEALKELTKLETLNLAGTQIKDIEALKGLATLQTLNLSSTQIKDIETLKGLTALRTLDLAHTQIKDIEPLKGLTALLTLDLSGTQINDIEALKGLTALQTLSLTYTQIKGVEALEGLTALLTLDLSGTQIEDIEALKGLTALQALGLSNTPIKDIGALKGLTALQRLSLPGAFPDSIDRFNRLRVEMKQPPVAPFLRHRHFLER